MSCGWESNKKPKGNEMRKFVMGSVMAIGVGLLTTWSLQADKEHKHDGEEAQDQVTVKGEVIDMACYIDHNAQGEKHADCAKKCIESGLPVGIKGEDGKTYLIIGEHKPLNRKLAKYAAQTVTVKGKLVSRDGINMLENAEVVK